MSDTEIDYDLDVFDRPGISTIDFLPRKETIIYRNKRGKVITTTRTVGPKSPLKKALLDLSRELREMRTIITSLGQDINAQNTADNYRLLPDLVHYNLRLLAAAIVIIRYNAGIEDNTGLNQYDSRLWSRYVEKVKPKIIDYYKGENREVRLEADLYRYVQILLDSEQV